MIINAFNPFYRVCRNEESPEITSGGGGRSAAPAEGLSARLAAGIASGDIVAPGIEVSSDEQPEPKPDKVAPVVVEKPVEKSPAKPAKEPEKKAEEANDEEEEFPEIGSKNTTTEQEDGKPSEFDEAAFDSETETTAKALSLKSEEAGRKFKELRGELKDMKKAAVTPDYTKSAEYQQTQTELTELRAIKEEVEGLRQRNQELLKVNDEVAVRESDEFKKRVLEPSTQMEAVITQMAEVANVDPQELFDIILEKDVIKQDKAIEAMESKLGARGVSRLGRFADDYKIIEGIKTDLLADAQKTIGENRRRQEEEANRDRQARTGQFQSESRSAFEKYASKVPGLTDSSGQLTDIAKTLQASTVSINPDDLSASDLGYMAFTAKAFPEMRRAYVKLQAENTALKAGKPATTKTGEGDDAGKGKTEEENSGKPQGLVDRMRGQEFTFDPNKVS